MCKKIISNQKLLWRNFREIGIYLRKTNLKRNQVGRAANARGTPIIPSLLFYKHTLIKNVNERKLCRNMEKHEDVT
jgi:hypothetical protein